MSEAKRVLVAGATGAVGRQVCALLKGAGHFVRTVSQNPTRSATLIQFVDDVRVLDATRTGALTGVCENIDLVISCLGAPVTLNLAERRSFSQIDVSANLALLTEAKRAGVTRFLYLACYVDAGFAHTRYVRAHESVVDVLRSSGLSYTVIRPTGIFSAFADLVKMARLGRLPLIGAGTTRTNPIHPQDVALGLMSVLSDGPSDLAMGGPDTMVRSQTIALALTAVGRPERFLRVPPGLFVLLAFLLRFLHPRLSDLLEFFAAVSINDSIAPTVGTRRLADYYRDVVASKA